MLSSTKVGSLLLEKADLWALPALSTFRKMTDRKIVFERAVRNPAGADVPPPEGWRFEYEDEKPKQRWRRLWYPNTQRWSEGRVYFGFVTVHHPEHTYAVSIEDD